MNRHGCVDSPVSDVVSEITLPDSDFTANPTNGPMPLDVTFTDTSVGVTPEGGTSKSVATKSATLEGGTHATWSWDFGDGNT
ncbi:MAG: hypothetical protein WCI71_06660, partial [Bacteroidota bacterium]